MNLDLNIDEFNPKKAELIALANKYSRLEIKDINDSVGYELVKEAAIELVHKRCEIQAEGKMWRKKIDVYRDIVFEKERELVKIVEPLEKELKAKREKIDQEIIIEARRGLLPERKISLAKYNAEIAEEVLLKMDDPEFIEKLTDAKAVYFAEIEKKQKMAAEKIEQDRKNLEEVKRLEEARIEAAKREREEAEKREKFLKEKAEREKKEDFERAEKEKKEVIERANQKAKEALEKAKKEKEEAIENEKRKAAEEKQRMVEAQKKKEEEQIAKVRKEKEKKEKEEQEAKIEQERLAKMKKYKQFLARNGYEEGEGYYILKTDRKHVLYKKIDEFIL